MSYVNVDQIKKNSRRSHDEALSIALQIFKRKVKESGVMNELRNRKFHRTPSQKRRFKENEAIKRRKREERKQQWYDKKHK